jgi:hypothetical protein
MVEFHKHLGTDAPKIKLKDIDTNGTFYETVSSIPTDAPTNFLEQVKIYVSGGDILLYVYDTTNSTWQKFNFYEAP